MNKTSIGLAALVLALAGCSGGGSEYKAAAPPLPVPAAGSASIGPALMTAQTAAFYCSVPSQTAGLVVVQISQSL